MKKHINKLVLVVLLIAVIVAVVVFRGFYIKDDIHTAMWEMFSDENINISDEQIEYKELRADFNNEAGFMLDHIKYNGTSYNYYFSTVPEELVDTSQCLMKVARYDDETKSANIYRIKETEVEYMLVAEMEGVYYQYKSRSTDEPDNIENYINKIGTKDKLDVEYIEVILSEGEDIKAQYIYGADTEKWVWDLLLGGDHDFEGWIPCQCTSGTEYVDYPKQYVKFNIVIRNNAANAVYKVYVLPNGNVGICDGMVDGQESEYAFSASELIEALQTLVDTYEAYKVE